MKNVKRILETEEITKIISKEVDFETGFTISLQHCQNGYNLFLNQEYMGTLSIDNAGPFHKSLTELLESFNVKYILT